MTRDVINVPYADTAVMLGLALAVLWLRLCGRNLRDLLTQATLSISGHLRPAPDQAMEYTLRTAFAQLDKELAEALGEQPIPCPRRKPAPDHVAPGYVHDA